VILALAIGYPSRMTNGRNEFRPLSSFLWDTRHSANLKTHCPMPAREIAIGQGGGLNPNPDMSGLGLSPQGELS